MSELNPAAVRVRLFAGLREAAGWSEQEWPITAASTAAQVWDQLGIGVDRASVRIAENQSFAADDQPLQPGDELAFLPPISGG